MAFDPSAPLFDVTPELDVDAIIPEAPPVLDPVEGQVLPNAYQVGDVISRYPAVSRDQLRVITRQSALPRRLHARRRRTGALPAGPLPIV